MGLTISPSNGVPTWASQSAPFDEVAFIQNKMAEGYSRSAAAQLAEQAMRRYQVNPSSYSTTASSDAADVVEGMRVPSVPPVAQGGSSPRLRDRNVQLGISGSPPRDAASGGRNTPRGSVPGPMDMPEYLSPVGPGGTDHTIPSEYRPMQGPMDMPMQGPMDMPMQGPAMGQRPEVTGTPFFAEGGIGETQRDDPASRAVDTIIDSDEGSGGRMYNRIRDFFGTDEKGMDRIGDILVHAGAGIANSAPDMGLAGAAQGIADGATYNDKTGLAEEAQDFKQQMDEERLRMEQESLEMARAARTESQMNKPRDAAMERMRQEAEGWVFDEAGNPISYTPGDTTPGWLSTPGNTLDDIDSRTSMIADQYERELGRTLTSEERAQVRADVEAEFARVQQLSQPTFGE